MTVLGRVRRGGVRGPGVLPTTVIKGIHLALTGSSSCSGFIDNTSAGGSGFGSRALQERCAQAEHAGRRKPARLPDLWVPKTSVTWADALRSGVGLVQRSVSAGPVLAWPEVGWSSACGLKLIFLKVSRAVSVLGLSRRESWWKDAEILMLRHQLAVAQRERPRAHSRWTWPDRAWLALLAGALPAEHLAAMRLIVTPGTILRWHRLHGCVRRGVPGRGCQDCPLRSPGRHGWIRSWNGGSEAAVVGCWTGPWSGTSGVTALVAW